MSRTPLTTRIDECLQDLLREFVVETTVPGGRVWKPDGLVDLHEAVGRACEDEEDGDLIAEEGVFGVLEAAGAECSTLLAFLWDSIGPCTWEARIHAVRVNDDVLLVFSNDAPEIPVFARVAHGELETVLPCVIEELIVENGENYVIGLFGGLPTCTENSCPSIIPHALLERAYRTWMDRYGEWDLLLDDLRSQIDEPDPMKRALGVLERLPRPDEWADYLARGAARNELMTESNKLYVMQLYFRLSYESYGD